MAARDVTIDYTNHRGERSMRLIRPERIWFGSSEWHHGDQWLLQAYDYTREDMRDFALVEIHSWAEGDQRNGG